MKIKILSPQHGDQVMELKPDEATDLILEEKKKGNIGFVVFSDGEVLQMMERTGILQQLEMKENEGASAKIIPNISGG